MEKPEITEEMWDEPLKTKAFVENNEIILE